MQKRILSNDMAQVGLLDHLAQTERVFRKELRKIDSSADCEVVAAADLGIPYDAIRLSGGFATGCFVQWNCKVPVVPVDITMNIDTSSVFWVDEAAIKMFTEENINAVKQKIEKATGYQWNFNTSNHFIIFVKEQTTGRCAIMIHSNEREFKNQYNGLCPTSKNWFERDLVVSNDGRIRLLIGRAAEIFTETAHMLEPFNVVRHRFVLHELLGSSIDVVEERHTHHYYMPTASAAALGCYVVPADRVVPIFSRPGKPIIMYKGYSGGPNTVSIDGSEMCIVPHGYGLALDGPLNLVVWNAQICRCDDFAIRR